MSKYLHGIKKFLIHNYGFLIIAIAIIYSSFMLYYIYKNIFDLYQDENSEKIIINNASVNNNIFESIITKQTEKQNSVLPAEISNPF